MTFGFNKASFFEDYRLGLQVEYDTVQKNDVFPYRSFLQNLTVPYRDFVPYCTQSPSCNISVYFNRQLISYRLGLPHVRFFPDVSGILCARQGEMHKYHGF